MDFSLRIDIDAAKEHYQAPNGKNGSGDYLKIDFSHFRAYFLIDGAKIQ